MINRDVTADEVQRLESLVTYLEEQDSQSLLHKQVRDVTTASKIRGEWWPVSSISSRFVRPAFLSVQKPAHNLFFVEIWIWSLICSLVFILSNMWQQMRSLFGRSLSMLMIYAQSVAQWRYRSGSFPVHTHLAGEYHVRQKWLVCLYFCVRLIWICFNCTLCFCFPTKMRHLNAPFFPLKYSIVFKKVIKCLENQWEAFFSNSKCSKRV